MTTTVNLTPYPNGIAGYTDASCVDVLVDDIDAGVSFVTVWRTVAGRSFKVRGLVEVSAGSAVTVVDAEAPVGVESSYRVEHFNSLMQRIGYSATSTVTLIGLAQDEAWFTNPLDPSVAVKVQLSGQSNRQLTRPIDYEMFRVPGRSVGVAIFTGSRRGYERLVLDCVTLTAEDEATFDSLFGGYDDPAGAIVCVRALPETRLPPTLFAVVAAPSKLPWDGADVGEQLHWGVVGDETAPPPEAIITALLDYEDFTQFYASYAAFTAAYLDYTAATRDYTIAGTA